MFEWLIGLMFILFIAVVVLSAKWMARQSELEERRHRRRHS